MFSAASDLGSNDRTPMPHQPGSFRGGRGREAEAVGNAVSRRRAGAGLVILALGAVALLWALPGNVGAEANPPGNNGTVKIDGVAFDDHPNNEPHVGCVFQVDFYGYDEGDLFADVTFEVHPPTGKVTILEDTCSSARTTTAAAARRPGSTQRDLRPVRSPARVRSAPPAGLAREADSQRRRVAGRRREAQGVLGVGLRDAATHDHNDHADDHDQHAEHDTTMTMPSTRAR